MSEADARKSWYYLAIQYDTKTDSTITWIGQIKNALKSISPEADKTFKILSKLDEIDFKKFQDNKFKDFIKENELSDKSLVRFLEDTNYSKKNLASYQQYLKDTGKATSTFTSITKKAGNVVKGFGAALGSMVVMWRISEVIGWVVTNLHDLATASEQAKENADSFAASANQLNENIANNSSTLSDLNSKYQLLSKGVNNLGENISLSSSEYDEYKNIISQVSEIMPGLTTYFNAQGEKIGFVKGKLADLNDEYEKTIQTTSKDLFYKGNEEGKTVQDTIDNIENNKKYGKFESFWKTAKASVANIFGKLSEDTVPTEDALNGLKDLQGKSKQEIHDYLKKVWTFADFEEGKRNVLRKTLIDMLDISDLDDVLEMDDEEFQELQEKISAKIEQFSADIESDVAKGRTSLIQALHMKDDFWDDSKLNDKQRDSIMTLVSSFNSELWDSLNLKNPDDIAIFAQKLIDNVSKDGDFSKAWNQLFGKELDKLPVDEYVTKVRSLIGTIGNAIGLESKDQQDKLLTNLGFDNLDELVNDYNGAIQSAAKKWKLDDSQREDLEKFFEDNSINTEEEIDAWKDVAAEAENAAEAKRKYLSLNSVNKGSQMLEELKKSYESASEDVTSLTTALSESVSGTGLSSDSVDTVTSMFSDLKGYDEDKLLDKTANGLRLNTRELEKLKKEYDDNTAKEFYNDVEDAYNAWQTALRNGEEQSVIDSLHDQYQQAAQLADQYVGLTSAYNQWQNALSTANEGDMYDTMQGKIKEMDKLWKSGKTNVDEFRAFADLISYKDLSGASQAEVEKAYSNSIGKIKRYFTEGEKGLENFLKDVHKANSEWAYMQKDGTWKFDFGVGGDKDVAKALGIDVEALQIILRKMSEYDESINIDFDFDSIAMMGKEADKAYRKLKKLGKIGKNIKFKFDTGDIGRVNTQIKDAEDVLNEFRDKDGNVDVNIKGAKEAQVILSKLMTEKQEIEKPAILKVDTSQLSGKAAGVVSMFQRIQQEINTYDVQVKVGADTTETEKKIKEDIKAVKANYGEELANVHINLDNIDSAKKELTSLLPEDIEVIANAIVNHKEVDDYKKEKEKKKIEVETELNDTAVNEFMNKTLEKTIKAKVEVDDSGAKEKDKKTKNKDTKSKKVGIEKSKEAKSSKADGTFNSLKGTLAARGFADASGNISIPKNQTALVNELGEELIVRDGRWFTVKGGAQFTELKKGDIVFNHLQTRQLLKNGRITSSDNRGRFAHSRGTFGNAFSNGLINFDKYKDGTPKTDSTKKSSKSKKSSKKSSKKKDSSQVIDWIERRLDVLQDKIDLTKAKLENLFSFKRQKNNLSKQVRETTRLLNAQEKAASKYKKKADSIKLSDSLKKNVREGKINGSLSELIKKYGEKTADQISRYQDYIDKVKDAKQAVEELKTAVIELSRQKLELKLEDNEKKREYKEAKYANAKTTDEKNKILKSEAKTYTSDDTAYKNYYIRAKKIRNKEGKEAKSAVSKVKGLSKKDKNQIKKLIKKGKEIPHALLGKVKKYNKSAYRQLVEYNYSVDFVSEALLEKKTANEENKTNIRDKKIEQHQNRADAAEAKYNVKQQREENAASANKKNKHEAASLKYLKIQYDHLIKIAKLEGDTTEQKRLQLEKQEKIAESYQKMYDNIKTEYENQTGLNDAEIATVQSQIATLEAVGKSATKEIYEGMMKVSADTKEKLLKERAELEEAGKKFEYGSEEWYAWQEDLLAIDQQMESCTQSTIEFQKAINELDLKKFSLMAAQLDATQSHLGFLQDMISHQDFVRKEAGGLTDAGLTSISLSFSDMENRKKAVENAQLALKELYRQHLNGKDGLNEEDFLAKSEEQKDIIRDNISAIADEKDAILELVEDALKVQMDAIDELIEKKKKALQSEKDYKKELYINYTVPFLVRYISKEYSVLF